MSKKLIILIVFFCLISLTGCSLYSSTPSASTKPVVGNNITISNFTFIPNVLEVTANTKVTWKNTDNVGHKIVSTNLFTSQILNQGDEFSYTFTTPGSYNYFCQIHPSMTGQVIVK
jgi:plastocyanin